MKNFALQQINNRIPLLKFRYLGSFPSEYVPTLDNDPYSLTQVYAAFIQSMQLFISSGFSRKKLQEFTMLMYSLLKVNSCNLSI